jgi:hypothetical protein
MPWKRSEKSVMTSIREPQAVTDFFAAMPAAEVATTLPAGHGILVPCGAQQIELLLTPPVPTHIRDVSHREPIVTPRGIVMVTGAR